MSPRPPIDHIRRPQILAAAIEVIAERGIAATRIADVAERAGTSPAGVLYWFKTKDELLGQALTADERRFADDLAARLPASTTPARGWSPSSTPASRTRTGPSGSSSGHGRSATTRSGVERQRSTTTGARC